MKAIGSRMKENYERCTDYTLTKRTPVIVRVDGRAFHSLKLDKPFDARFQECMQFAAQELSQEMQGFKLGYIQSDEASFLLTDFDNLNTEPWFNNELRKICSISAAIMTKWFCYYHHQDGIFDSRAFNIPLDEVANYFLWRALDWERNSIQMLAQSHYSHKDLYEKNQADMHQMLYEKEVNWTDLDDVWKNGTWLIGLKIRYDIKPKYEEIQGILNQCLEKK